MRRAMYEAEVGDDVFGEDPTVNALEERAAALAGKEAALFVPSGTMGNQIAIAVHTSPGQELLCERNAHILLYEMGMLARFSGCMARPIATDDGRLSWDRIRGSLRTATDHFRGTGLIELENTHKLRRRAGLLARIYRNDLRERACGRDPGAHGRRPRVPRRRRARQACARGRRSRRLADILPFERVGRSRRFSPDWKQSLHCRGEAGAQGTGWRHAAGWGPGGCRAGRAGAEPGQHTRGACERQVFGRLLGADSGYHARSVQGGKPISSSSTSWRPA